MRGMQIAPHVSPDGCLTLIPGGVEGIMVTLRKMRDLVRQQRTDPRIVGTARSLVFHTPDKDALAEIRVLFEFVRDRIRYVQDVYEVETLSTPVYTLRSRSGDCDDQVTLLASLIEAIGYPTRFVVGAYHDPSILEHVYLEVYAHGEWIACDPTERNYLGWAPPNAMAIYTEHIN